MLDLYSFYASTPIGYNHPQLDRPEVEAELLAAAKIKIANSDMYSVPFANFVDAFARVMAIRGDLADCFARLGACGADPGLVALCRRCLAFASAIRPDPSVRPDARFCSFLPTPSERSISAAARPAPSKPTSFGLRTPCPSSTRLC